LTAVPSLFASERVGLALFSTHDAFSRQSVFGILTSPPCSGVVALDFHYNVASFSRLPLFSELLFKAKCPFGGIVILLEDTVSFLLSAPLPTDECLRIDAAYEILFLPPPIPPLQAHRVLPFLYFMPCFFTSADFFSLSMAKVASPPIPFRQFSSPYLSFRDMSAFWQNGEPFSTSIRMCV